MNNKLSLASSLKLLALKEITSEDLVKDCLEAVKKYNGKLNAYLTLNENARQSAESIKSKKYKRNAPILGIPYAIKDNFLTKNIRTTASSFVLEDYIPVYSATVVNRLEDAGGIILGKTNMDAWAHGSSTETSDYGATKNPWNLNHLPGGSSGGSAAAVVADLCIFAIGSETAGSVRQPAAWCGCVGLKPTYGRVSRYGVIAMGSSLDSPGPMTKTVEDAAILLEILAGHDPYDATTSPKKVDKYTSFLSKGVNNLKIGISSDYLLPQMRKEVKDIIMETGKVFEKLGAKVDLVSTMNPEYAIGVYTVIQRCEVSSNLARYDGIRFGNDRFHFGQEAKRRITLGTFALSAGYADKYYKKAQKVRTLYIKDFENIFKKYDLIIGPTSPGPAQKLGASKGQAMFGEMEDVLVEPSTISGLPGISIPCGVVDGLPIGLDIIGPQFSEGLIIQAANAYEKATIWHNQKPNGYE
jgi:aspartyl-tRNA(Asn)/glutamyl-tRNA(Gln) amidotransferase subunit A